MFIELIAIVRAVFIFASFVLLISCTKNTDTDNSHSSSPKLESVDVKTDSNVLLKQLEEITVNDKVNAQGLKLFYKNRITDEFLSELSLSRSPENHRALTRFHYLMSLEQSSLSDKKIIKNLSLSYYLQVQRICQNNFTTCELLKVYKGSVYAIRVFSLLEELLTGKESKKQHSLFLFIIGKGAKSHDLAYKELYASIDNGISDANSNKIVNLVLLLSSQSKEIAPAYVKKIISYVATLESSDLKKKKFQTVITQILFEKSSGSVLSKDYMKSTVLSSQYYKIMQSDSLGVGGLAKNLFVSDKTYKSNWMAHFILLGMIDHSISTDWHKKVAKAYLSVPENRERIINLAQNFLYRNFFLTAYKSHKRLGEEFNKRLKKYQKVDAFLFDYNSRYGGHVLSQLWVQFYETLLKRVSTGLNQYFSKEELNPIKKISVNLDKNIATMVIFPSLFATGYHSLKQGDFDFIVNIGGKIRAHIDKDLYFSDLFKSRLASPFSFLRGLNLSSKEILTSFYISLDKKILDFYSLKIIDVSNLFISRYLNADKKKLSTRFKRLEDSINEKGIASKLTRMCKKILNSDFNFTFDKHLDSIKKDFFFGEPSNRFGSGLSVGTSYFVSKYSSIFNGIKIKENISEDLEFLRSDLYPKIFHMEILEKALRAQGESQQADRVKKYRENIDSQINNFFTFSSKNFFTINECVQEFAILEETMKLTFISKEKDFLKSTHKVLYLLNQYKKIPNISELRLKHSDIFKLPYLKKLPNEGDFFQEVNKIWFELTQLISSQVTDYRKNTKHLLGFSKNERDQYVFLTSKDESIFRKIALMQEATDLNAAYPKLKILKIPSEYEELIESSNLMKSYSNFYSFDFQSSEDDFIFNIFLKIHNKNLMSLSSRNNFFKTVLMNTAAVFKFKSFIHLKKDRLYRDYPNKISLLLQKDFENLQVFTNKLVKYYNISSSEAEVLSFLRTKSFLSSDLTYVANGIFIYNNFLERKILGLYDVFFNAIASYSLGYGSQFREGLYQNTDYKYLTNIEWITTNNKIKKITLDDVKYSLPQAVDVYSEDLLTRRNHLGSIKESAPIIKSFKELFLFDVGSDLNELINHELKYPIIVDEATALAFFNWLNKISKDKTPPYYFNLNDQKTENPEYLTIKRNYQASQTKFHIETFGVYKIDFDSSKNSSKAPQSKVKNLSKAPQSKVKNLSRAPQSKVKDSSKAPQSKVKDSTPFFRKTLFKF